MGLSGALVTLVESNRTPVETKVARGRRTIEASGVKWSIRKPNRAQVNLMESRARRTPKEPIVEQGRSEVTLYPVHNVQFVKYIFPRNRTTSNLS